MRKLILASISFLAAIASHADEARFAGIVSTATPEATAAGVAILEAGGNAVDAAVAVSLTLGVTEPAGSGIAGQTVMLIKRAGEPAFVVQGTTWSPRSIPGDVTDEDLAYGRTAATVPSTLRVLDLAHRRFGSGTLDWAELVLPAASHAENGFIVGPFRQRAFRNYGEALSRDDTARAIFFREDGSAYRVGDRLRQPLLAATLRRIATLGAMDFYEGGIAREIAAHMQDNGGWITLEDLAGFPEPRIVPALQEAYRGHTVETLPPPFGGWVVLKILGELEALDASVLDTDDSKRRLALLDALRTAHGLRRSNPITEYTDYDAAVDERLGRGETTHFSIVDGEGTAVAVTQSIDSYFGSKVAHPTLGFLYNNYMQGFQVDDPDAPYYIAAHEMPLSSMSATVVSQNDAPELVLGSPGSARIISSVAQVTSYWVDVARDVVAAVGAYRVHVVPEDSAYVEGGEIPSDLLAGMAARGLRLLRPKYGVSDSHHDAYFGGIHGLAFEGEAWTGAADPRRDGTVAIAYR
jgi:gamma-glutamyltranspeptidase/glutathione hydrolase